MALGSAGLPLKSAVVGAEHLKSFDVITLDSYGPTRRRYQDFITFKYFRFSNSDVTEYLGLLSASIRILHGKQLRFNTLERVHNKFMQLA